MFVNAPVNTVTRLVAAWVMEDRQSCHTYGQTVANLGINLNSHHVLIIRHFLLGTDFAERSSIDRHVELQTTLLRQVSYFFFFRVPHAHL